jgi:hypothetical protein
MNPIKRLINGIQAATIMTLSVMALGMINTNAADSGVKGNPAYKWAAIETVADVEAVKPGDSIAMACAKCKTISVTTVTQDTKTKTKLLAGEKHLCPGCGSTITVVGDKAHNKQVVKHVCKVCGDESAFCCVTNHGGGHTEGMDKDKKEKKH